MKMLSYNDLTAKGISYSAVHLWRLWRVGKFPKPVKLGENRNAWVESEIDKWIADRVKERDSNVAA
jgi:prophage regulatory protein